VANELAHINTRHPDFRDKALKALSDFLTQPVQENSALKEISLIEEGTNLKFQALDGVNFCSKMIHFSRFRSKRI
jgi:hypothetical protein